MNYVAELSVFRDGYLSAFSMPKESPDYSLVWLSKSLVFRVLTDRTRALSEEAGKDSKVRKLVDEWREARQRLAGLMLSQASLLDPERAKQLAELTREKENLERQVNATAARNLLSPVPPTLKDLVARLPEQAAFVDIFKYSRLSPAAWRNTIAPSYMAFVVRRNRKTVAVDLGPAKAIEEALAKWIAQIQAELPEDAAEVVHRLVWRPLSQLIPTGKGATVYISPDSELARLPWAALPGRKGGTVLLQECRLALVPNGTYLAGRLAPNARRFATKPAEGTFLLVADVAYSQKPASPFSLASARPLPAAMRDNKGGQYEDLKGTAIEADWIKPVVRKLPGSPPLVERRKEKASVAQVLADLSDARVAHIATHGVFASLGPKTKQHFFRSDDLAVALNGMRLGAAARNPLTHTALVLAGANLKPGPGVGACLLSGEMLAGRDLRRGRLCVLPNCHTAKGEEVGGEGAYGLQRALHQAGFDDAVAGLWQVPDDKTPPAMLVFYHYLSSGMPPIDALREAQLFLLRNSDANRVLAVRHAPGDVVKLVAARPRGDDPDFLPRKSSPRKKGDPKPGSTKDWAVFVLSGLGE